MCEKCIYSVPTDIWNGIKIGCVCKYTEKKGEAPEKTATGCRSFESAKEN